MSPEQDHIVRTIEQVRGLADTIVDLTGERIDQVNEALDYRINTLRQITELRVSAVEATLMVPVTLIYKQAVYHTLRAYWHASPSIILILSTIWAVIQVIWRVVKYILTIIEVIQTLKIDDLLASYWPQFEEARNRFREFVSELSETIGWGVDGFLHLLHATQGFTDVLGGLTGKTYTWMDAQWMEKTGNLLEKTSNFASQLKDRPGEILEILFQGELKKSMGGFKIFGDEISGKFRNLTLGATRLFEGLGDVASELSAIQINMPEVIRANIPQAIWNNLDGFSDTISTQILPRLSKVEKGLTLFESVFVNQSDKLSDLADKLAHPGTNLLGINDLPDFAKYSELFYVDEIASKLFSDSVNSDRDGMQSDLDAFAIIDKAATSPLPVLPFMDIESPARGALHGIVVEPQETWFVGGYDSQY